MELFDFPNLNLMNHNRIISKTNGAKKRPVILT